MQKAIFVCLLAFLWPGAARAQVEPPWSDRRAPRGLRITVEQLPGPGIAARATKPAEHKIPRAGKVRIDAEFGDWADANWVTMSGADHHFGDNVEMTVTIEVPAGVTPTDDHSYLGFSYDQMDPDYEKKYALDQFYDYRGVVVTAVRLDSPGAKAGLREGDVIFEMAGGKAAWAYQVYGAIERARTQTGPQSIPVKIRRNGLDRLGGPDDLAARFAFLVDDENLYFAAQVTDDVHSQSMDGWHLWKNDCIQIGFDPTLARLDDGYGLDGHEIGFALKDGQPMAWRWKGRGGQPEGAMADMALAVERKGNQTLYEAAVPLAELVPLSPDMWPHCGINVLVNDNDGGRDRKARLELRPGAMTKGKQMNRFVDFEFAPGRDRSKISFAWFWDYRLQPTGKAAWEVAVHSPTPTRVRIAARFESWDGFMRREAEPARAEDIEIPVTSEPTEWRLEATTRSQPAEYRLEWVAYDPQGAVVARDGIPLFVRP